MRILGQSCHPTTVQKVAAHRPRCSEWNLAELGIEEVVEGQQTRMICPAFWNDLIAQQSSGPQMPASAHKLRCSLPVPVNWKAIG